LQVTASLRRVLTWNFRNCYRKDIQRNRTDRGLKMKVNQSTRLTEDLELDEIAYISI
jgi:hypothetical protein